MAGGERSEAAFFRGGLTNSYSAQRYSYSAQRYSYSKRWRVEYEYEYEYEHEYEPAHEHAVTLPI